MSWQSPSVKLPPQGVKILWFKNGDIFIAQRIGKKYLSLQPGEAKLLEEPKLWMIAPMPEPYTGKIVLRVVGESEMMTVDELEQKYPEDYKDFVKAIEDTDWKKWEQ